MDEETCELCGYQSQLRAVGRHYIIPNEVTQQAGMPESKTVRMCCNCRRELDTWYSDKITKMVFDTKIQRFRDKTWPEMVEEYQSVFNGFANYKKRGSKRNSQV